MPWTYTTRPLPSQPYGLLDQTPQYGPQDYLDSYAAQNADFRLPDATYRVRGAWQDPQPQTTTDVANHQMTQFPTISQGHESGGRHGLLGSPAPWRGSLLDSFNASLDGVRGKVGMPNGPQHAGPVTGGLDGLFTPKNLIKAGFGFLTGGGPGGLLSLGAIALDKSGLFDAKKGKAPSRLEINRQAAINAAQVAAAQQAAKDALMGVGRDRAYNGVGITRGGGLVDGHTTYTPHEAALRASANSHEARQRDYSGYERTSVRGGMGGF